ncbi:MAG TPA: AMP-binding protein [Candidatus Acidoferrum sp.]|nr:AMP-binding protein [Candidatus Acidoferrum sp.]
MPPPGSFPKRLSISNAQSEQLRALVSAVVGPNPFYTKKFERSGTYKIRHLGDLADNVPFTTKTEIVEDQLANPPYGTNLTYPLDRYSRCSQTSGTTGTPLRWLDTPESWDWMLRNWLTIYAAAEVTRSDVIYFPFSFGPFLGFWTAFEAGTRLGALCLPGGGLSSAARLRAILDHNATVLCATPSYAMRLAEVAAEEKIDLTASPVKLIILAGEAGGSVPATRARLEDLWPGARVFDHHGMTEVGPVTFECPAKPGRLHVIETSYIAEIINPNTGVAALPDETGELVLTNLGRIGSPLIRYRTGDLVKSSHEHFCDCGRQDLALDGGIIGRVDDMIVVRGVNIYPTAVEEVVRGIEGVVEYSVNISNESALTEIAVSVEFAAMIDAPEQVRRLETAFERAFSLRVPVIVAEPGSLPRAEAKAKRWIRST